MRIELTIEQLVLRGVPKAEADQVLGAIEAELVRRLGQADPQGFTGGAIPAVRAEMPADPSHGKDGPTRLGTSVGAVLGNTVTGGGRR